MCRIKVRVIANSHHPGLVGFRGDVLHLKVSAPPVDNRANRELCELIAEALKVASSLVNVRYGHMARQKVVELSGIDEGPALAILRQRFAGSQAGIV